MPWRHVRHPRLQLGLQPIARCAERPAPNRCVHCPTRYHTTKQYASGTFDNAPSIKPLTRDTVKDVDKVQASSNEKDQPSIVKHAVLQEREARYLDTTIKIAGLVRSIRKQKKVAFAHISDGTTLDPIQAILSPEVAKDVNNGSYVELRGTWKKSMGKEQDCELQVDRLVYVGDGEPETSPIQKKSQTVDHLRNYPHLRLRLPLYSLLARIRSTAVAKAHEFYSRSEEAAFYVQPPLITSSDCEGAGEVFTVSPKLKATPHKQAEHPEQTHYFRTPKYLTVSSQLHLEAYAAELGDVWTLSPAFRAEESDTGRHLAELSGMLEAEHRGVTSIEQLTAKVQALIQHTLSSFMAGFVEKQSTELANYYANSTNRQGGVSDVDLGDRWLAVGGNEHLEGSTPTRWQHITYTQATRELEQAASQDPSLFANTPSWNNGLNHEHERWITKVLGDNKPVFVTHYPRAQKPFYMLDSTSDTSYIHDPSTPGPTVACFDLLLPFGTAEVCGGSLREHGLKNLISNMREKGLLTPQAGSSQVVEYPFLRESESLNTLQWYADLRRYGSSPHGGFGIGFDRLLMYATGVENVREIVGFPRTWGVAHC